MAVGGLKSCWAAKVLGMLVKLGEISSLDAVAVPDLCKLVIDVDRVVGVLHSQILMSLTSTHADPRTCPSEGAKQCTYMQWFAHADRTVYHPHVKCITISFGKHRELMRYRLGCADTAVNAGRMVHRHVKKPRAERICPCCDSGQAEDELHQVLECTAYDDIRSKTKFAVLFGTGRENSMTSIFCDMIHQSIVADFVRAVSVRRKQLVAAG